MRRSSGGRSKGSSQDSADLRTDIEGDAISNAGHAVGALQEGDSEKNRLRVWV